ncbi:hypothetical protein DRP53_08955 [candidate division WOR-3 bacterium]|uniref:Uncharacterized protein n=1 Tax=candidate division WOR-3 bacterium TaxID=2052148 RepID=A0A660SEI2_UNCW3|nr:MAG: hypothetical protein DRP53_08955 [candidate division WOR-3 bacterium]
MPLIIMIMAISHRFSLITTASFLSRSGEIRVMKTLPAKFHQSAQGTGRSCSYLTYDFKENGYQNGYHSAD